MCDFKADSLLKLRRKLAVESGKEYDLVAATTLIRTIDDLRFRHEINTGCKCWQTALEAA